MSSLLRPIVCESFQTDFRRRSFISSLTVVPQYLPENPSCAPEDSAIFDSDETDQHETITTPVESSTEFVVPVLSPVTDAHMYLPESPSCTPEDSAVFDSDETDQHEIMTIPVESSTEFVVPVLSPVTNAHMSDYESKITIPRHHNTLHMIATFDASSPTSTSPHPASRKLSFTALDGESKPALVKLERLRWRLASGFFSYFICGWADGGKLFKKQEFRRTCSFTSFLVTGIVIPCKLLMLI